MGDKMKNTHIKVLLRTVWILVISLLAACATTYQLSGNVLAMRNSMTAERADSILAKYASKQGNRAGMCVIGISSDTSLVGNDIKVAGARINFSMNYPISGGTEAQGGRVILKTRVTSGPAEVDVSKLKQIRLVEVNDSLKLYCSSIRMGTMVGLKTQKSLPDSAEVAFNTTTTAELEELLAAVTYLSPETGIKSGLGM
jgi:hypothetical protein